MLRVRFASGLLVQYNDANFCEHSQQYHDLYAKSGDKKTWVATVPLDCIVEAVEPCAVRMQPLPPYESMRLDYELRTLKAALRALAKKVKK